MGLFEDTSDQTTDLGSIVAALDDFTARDHNTDLSLRSGSLDRSADPPQVRSFEGELSNATNDLTPNSASLAGWLTKLFQELKIANPIVTDEGP